MNKANKEDSYKINLEINKDEILKDFREIKQEVEQLIKDTQYSINKLALKRKDVLIVQLNGFFKAHDLIKIEKQMKKALHRKVLVVDNLVKDIHVIEK